MKKDIVVVGGGPAGFSAASSIVAMYPDADVTLINRELDFQIPCSLPFVVGGIIEVEKNIYPLRKLVDLGVNLMKADVVSVDPSGSRLFLGDGKVLAYDKLVLATGWVPFELFEGDLPKNIEYVTVDTDSVRCLVEKVRNSRDIVVVGAGFVGLGFADVISSVYQDKKITVADISDSPCAGLFSENIADSIVEILSGRGVQFLFGRKVKGFSGDSRVEKVVLEDGLEIDADLVIVSVGFLPNSKLAVDAGIEVNDYGEIVVDGFMRTSIDNVFAAGACAEHICVVDAKRFPAMLASVSSADGRLVAVNIYGPVVSRSGIVPSAVSRIGKLYFGFSGFTENVCLRKGIGFSSGLASSMDRYPSAMGGGSVWVKLIGSSVTGKLIGAEVWGETEKIPVYIDLISRMIEAGYSVEQVVSVSMVAFPPSTPSPLFAPVQSAAVSVLANFRR